MKKRLFAMSLAAGFTVLLTACGDETTNTDIIKAETFATADSLPECNKDFAGKFATVADKKQILICAQDGSSFDWLPVAVTVQSATDSSGSTKGCTAKALKDGTGVEVLCNGKSVAVVKNGAKGDQGLKGEDGDPGSDGGKGADGKAGAPGQDFKLDSSYCSAKDYGYGTIIYDCNGQYYAVDYSDEAAHAAKLATWKSQYFTNQLLTKQEESLGFIQGVHLESAAAGTSQGKIARWEGDDSWDYTLSLESLASTLAISGKATLTVSDGATQYAGAEVEPLVGLALTFENQWGYQENQKMLSWRGVCLTYTATDTMQVIVKNSKGKVARASIAPATDTTVADILATEFAPDSENVNLVDVMNDAEVVYIKAVGSLEPGTYENTFAIYEFGVYGECAVPEINLGAIKAAVLESLGEATPDLEDGRIDPTDPEIYKTVKIGNRVWMAENLRKINYSYTIYDSVRDEDVTYHLSYCPTDPDSLVAFGCYYTWSAAMDSAGQYLKGSEVANGCSQGTLCEAAQPVRGICPDGWHLPSIAEAEALLNIISSNGEYPELAGAAMAWLGMSKRSPFYIDDLGYEDFPGYKDWDGWEYFWWLSENTDLNGDNYYYDAYTVYLNPESGEVALYTWRANMGLPVRCVQDVEE